MNPQKQKTVEVRRQNEKLYEAVEEIKRAQEPQIQRDSGRLHHGDTGRVQIRVLANRARSHAA